MATELTFRQYKTPVMKRIGGALLLATGVMFLAFTAYYAAKDIPLWVFGKQTKAEIVEIWLEQLNELEGREDGVLDFSYNVKYQFTTPNGDLITKATTTSAIEWSGMWEGQKINIVLPPLVSGTQPARRFELGAFPILHLHTTHRHRHNRTKSWLVYDKNPISQGAPDPIRGSNLLDSLIRNFQRLVQYIHALLQLRLRNDQRRNDQYRVPVCVQEQAVIQAELLQGVHL